MHGRHYHARMRAFILVVMLSALTACRAASPGAAPPADATAATSLSAPVESGVTLNEGFGRHHHVIATSSAEAQRYFDQGIALVFGFNHEEAVRSFQKAAELDPQAAMPHWGIAWALGPNYNLDVDDARAKQANEAIARATALAARGPAVERDYIAAMAIRFPQGSTPDRAALAAKYSDAMGELSRRYPDDLDAATLYAESLMNLRAWKLWTLDGQPAERTEEIVRVLETVLTRDPQHIGANHYFIHTVEASTNPGRALASAMRLDSLAPAAGHLTHMPAHIYARVGDQAGAARANEAGANADREYFKSRPSDSFYAMAYYPHNLHFLADSEMMRGRFSAAAKAAEEVERRLAPHTEMMPMVESMITMKTSVLLRFNRHADVLALPQPAANHPVEVAWWHFARGVAFARTGKADDAAAERVQLAQASAVVPESALFGGTGLETARTILSLAATVLDARLAWARGARDESIRLWRTAVAQADKVPYDEPPIFYYPVRESLGAALLLAGDVDGAERVFRDDLVKHPRNPRSLFGLHEVLMKKGDTASADWVQREFAGVWKDAEVQLALDTL